MNVRDRAPVLGLEQIQDGEEEATRKVIEFELGILRKTTGNKRPVPRAQHPKHHGCVRAEFVIANEIPNELKFGVFGEAGKTFPAWIRFSNARKQDDQESGAHGMAIKLMGVTGEKLLVGQQSEQTQDFLLLDSQVFFIRNAIEFADFDAALLKSELSWFGKLSVLEYFVKHPREALILHQIENNQSSNPLETQYWSATPYKLGAGAVKYSAKPCLDGPPIAAATPSRDQLRAAMKLNLETRDAFFDFYVQPQVDPIEQPIEDATHLWQISPQKVATMRIPVQSFDSSAQMKFCENLSFNPWHALADHRPLGSLNRLRKATYLALSNFRHEENHVASVEPSPEIMRPDSKPAA
jgi:Catalase